MNFFIQHFTKALIASVIMFSLGGNVLADTVVVISSSNSISTLSKGDIKKIYLGKNKKINAVDQLKGSNIRDDFLSKIVGKSEGQYKAYWSKKIFSGKGIPPKSMGGIAVKRTVASSNNTIGYIDSKDVDASVKVIYTVK